MTNSIQTIIANYQQKQKSAADQKKLQLDGEIAKAVEALQKAFSQIWDQLQAPGEDQVDLIQPHFNVGDFIGITMPARLEGWEPVHRFYLAWVGGYPRLSDNTHNIQYSGWGVRFTDDNKDAIAKFFMEQQEKYEQKLVQHQQEVARNRNLAINKYSAWLAPGRASHIDDLESKNEALQKLIELDAANEKDWRDLYGRYMGAYQAAVKAHQVEQAELKRKIARARKYQQAYARFKDDSEKVIQKNKLVLADLQVQYAEKFMLYELEYGLIAFGESDDPYIETETVKVLSPEPDAGNWYTVVDARGHVLRKRFFHPISMSEALIYDSGQTYNYVCRATTDDTPGFVYFAPTIDPKPKQLEIQAKLVELITPLPDVPDPSDYGLSPHTRVTECLESGEAITDEVLAQQLG